LDLEEGLIRRYLVQKLKEANTYVVALVVGTFINLYGHILVPWLRGVESPFGRFMDELEAHPGTVWFSIFIAYLFPIIVGTYSSVATLYQNRGLESLAHFPDKKPDPVFRAKKDGKIIEAGETTRHFLDAHEIKKAQDIFGPELWQELLKCDAEGKQLPPETAVEFKDGAERFLVAHSSAHEGAVNIYLTRTEPQAKG
jgi:hypothetical protein